MLSVRGIFANVGPHTLSVKLATTYCLKRCHRRLKYLIESGKLGEVTYYEGRLFLQMGEEVGRLYDPEMGGGALMDIGLYMIALASWVYGGGIPEVLQASAVLHENQIDTTGSINLK